MTGDAEATLTVDDLSFEVRRSPRRRSVQITVDRGGELVLSAPDDCALSAMEGFVREKRFWIYTKLAEKEALRAETRTRHYVSGEGFPYLGRSYRLLLVDHQETPIKLEQGRFKMLRSAAPQGQEHMIRWYSTRGEAWLRSKVPYWAKRVGAQAAGLTVKPLGYRWGSCGKGDRLYLHWKSILLPPRIVEYILVHELIHLHEPHHTPNFWLRLERALPDFAKRKQWLAENGQRWTGV
jgi:predicted metal-dependent hydrolase